MERYINYTGDSTITHYEIGDEYIRIKCKKEILEYHTSSNSKEQIEEMKALAKEGIGLYRYIRKNKVKEKGAEEGGQEKTGVYEKIKLIFSFK